MIILLLLILHFQLLIILILPHPITALHSVRSMSIPKGANMVLERPLVLEIRPADAEPEPPAVLLVRPPVTSHCKRLPALPAPERLRTVLPLVVRLERPEVLQRPRPWVLDVVLAALRAAVAGKPQHRGCWLCAPKRFGAFSVLRAVSPHVHLLCCNALGKILYEMMLIFFFLS